MPKARLDTYEQAVAYVESFISGPAEAVGPRDPVAQARMQAGRLPRMAALLASIGNPQDRFRSVHVGGTSGKGSTCALVGAMLRAAGYRVGVYTSPYLQTAIEKIQVDGRLIPPQDFVALVNDLRPLLESAGETDAGPLAYAQVWAALAFAYFVRREVDLAVVEVGMGGRYDYTNVLPSSVAAITNVSYDHTAALGPMLLDIAWHKAGIIKPGGVVVTGAEQSEVLDAINWEAAEQKARLQRVEAGCSYIVRNVGPDGGVFDYHGPHWSLRDLKVSLLGEHQIANAALALAAVEQLAEHGFGVTEESLRRGLEQVQITGRLEVMQDHPLVVLDGAHNPEKARRLAEALRRLFPGRRIIFVLGILSAKERMPSFRVVPLADLVVASAPSVLFKPAVPPQDLAQRVSALGCASLWEADPRVAIDMALDAAGPDGLVCVTGSLYLVGEAREHLGATEELLNRGCIVVGANFIFAQASPGQAKYKIRPYDEVSGALMLTNA